jgi:dTDP-4-dehydrorhamnose reductase
MKVAVIGAKGMLGRTLCHVLSTRHELLAWDIEEIDITVRQQAIELLRAEQPELIINSAVFVNLEGCESEPDKAWRINAVGAQNLVRTFEAGRRTIKSSNLSTHLCCPDGLVVWTRPQQLR